MIEKQKLKKLYEKCGTMIEVARKTEWSYNAVKYWIDKYGIPKNSRREVCCYTYWRGVRGIDPSKIVKAGKKVTVKKIKDLYYRKGLSADEIAEKIGWSQDMVYTFMNNHDLKRRSSVETNRIKFRKQKPSFEIKRNLSAEEEKLKIAGIMLYWAEGAKWCEDIIDLANSDTMMIKLFLKFLREICGINEKRLRVLLYCYANQNVEFLKKYWHKTTNIPLEQFIKPYVRQDFDPKKKGRMQYGLIHVRYSDKKLFFQIQDWIKEYLDKSLHG